MNQAEKYYPFGKSMMLNAIYDTLERLGASVTSSNSERGRIQFQANDKAFILKIDTIYPQETVRVTITSDSDALDCSFSDALFDEINSMISTIKVK